MLFVGHNEEGWIKNIKNIKRMKRGVWIVRVQQMQEGIS
jgi:hypothetical protein